MRGKNENRQIHIGICRKDRRKLINDFCVKNYGITFDQFSKIDVNGANADPLFAYLRDKTGAIPGDVIKWNFTKFLVNRDGEVIKRYDPLTEPKDIEKDIKELL